MQQAGLLSGRGRRSAALPGYASSTASLPAALLPACSLAHIKPSIFKGIEAWWPRAPPPHTHQPTNHHPTTTTHQPRTPSAPPPPPCAESFAVAKVRHAEQQLLREVARLQQRGAAPQLSPPLDPRCLGRLAPFSPQQVRQWRQMLERVAAANAADPRSRGAGSGRVSGRSGAAAADSRAAGGQAAGGKAARAEAMPAASAGGKHASGTAVAQALSKGGNGTSADQGCAVDAGRPARRGASSAGQARSAAPIGSTAGKALRAAKAQADSSHFQELVGIAAAGSAARP